MSGFWVSSIVGAEPSSAFLILASLHVGRPEVGGGGGHHDRVGRGRGRATASRSCAVVSTRTTLTPAGSGSVDVGGHQGDLGAAGGGGPGQRVALQARGAVAEEADRVEVLAGAAGGDHDVATGQVGRRDAPRASTSRQTLEDLVRLGQPALAGVGAGQPALGGLDDQGAALAQRGDVGRGGGVLPHLGVHRRGEHDRAARGEQRVGEQVVGQAVRGPGQQVGGGRGDDDEVGRLADPDVRDLVHVVPHLGGDRLAGQRRPGGGADELAAPPRSGRR